ncbi:FkbM family methyltransferase [Bosea thiooxidans]
MNRNLIFDIGVNHGEDSQFYLAKGFNVVGVEANPILAEENRICQKHHIEAGAFTIENVGVMAEAGELSFYRNLANDHWSSFFENYGCRDGTPFEVVPVRCVTIRDLLEKYGCPYYMKIDVEGADKIILTQLRQEKQRPAFISVEEFGVDTFEYLLSLGYDAFSVREQLDKSWASSLEDSREGRFVKADFTHRDSGVFGLDISDWKPLEGALAEFHRKVRSTDGEWLAATGEFFDIHATTRAVLAAEPLPL